MSLADRDYMRRPPPRRRVRPSFLRVLSLAVAGAALVVATRAEGLLQPFGASLQPGVAVLDSRSGLAVGGTWPGGVLRIRNEAPDQEWALQQAVAAWNRSGANVRLVAASRGDADVTIVHASAPVCGHGQATLGYAPDARIEIFPRDDRLDACDAYSAAQVLTHELGHVLGLEHDDARCSLMNSKGSYRGGSRCELTPPWTWHCRLLEPTDVQRVVDLYGGSALPPQRPRACALYRPVAQPTIVVADEDVPPGWLAVDVVRPFDAAVPAFAPSGGTDTLSPRLTEGACGAPRPPGERYRWRAAPGTSERLTYRLRGARTYCLTVWAFDRLGRPSTAPAQLQVDAAA